MILSKTRMSWLGLGALWALTSGLPAVADDTELFIGNSLTLAGAAEHSVRHRQLRQHGLARADAGQLRRQHDVSRGQRLRRDARLLAHGHRQPADLRHQQLLQPDALTCERALNAFATAGYYTDNMAQYDPIDRRRRPALGDDRGRAKNRVVECEDDRGVHGDGVDTTNLCARNGQHGVPRTLGHGWPANRLGRHAARTKSTRSTAATT